MVKKRLEIKRRWLLKNLSSAEILGVIGVEWAGLTTVWLTTVYVLSDPDLKLRIRQRSSEREITHSVEIKIGSGLTRLESSELLTDADLFNYYITQGKPYLIKSRWTILLETGLKLEINRFNEPKFQGLMLAEMKFESEKIANDFSENNFPVWLKPLIVKEVTDDPRYNGKNLAVNGRPDPA